jgi:hypothetical protein
MGLGRGGDTAGWVSVAEASRLDRSPVAEAYSLT